MTDVEFLLNCYIEDKKPIRNEDERYSLKCRMCGCVIAYSSHCIIVSQFESGTVYDGMIHDAECKWNEAKNRLRRLKEEK